MKTAAIIQARMGSRRFPGKSMADLCGKPVLQHVIERTKEIGIPVVLSTPDPELYFLALKLGINADIGQRPPDLLKHYLEIAQAQDIDVVMRITGDCPLLRPDLCKEVLELYREGDCAYAAIGWPMTFPKGYGCEVFSRKTLELADAMTKDQYDREHVTPWMENNLHCRYLTQENDESHINYSIDTPEDLERVRGILSGQDQDHA